VASPAAKPRVLTLFGREAGEAPQAKCSPRGIENVPEQSDEECVFADVRGRSPLIRSAVTMGIDAIALLRPRNNALLRKHTSQLIPLEDGSVFFLTAMRYSDFEADPVRARAYLESEFGCALGKVQNDARGVFMFTDVGEPSATTYDGVVAEIEAQSDGFWVPLDDSSEAGRHAARASASKNAKISRRGRELPSFLRAPFAVPEVPTDAPLFSGDVADLEKLAGSFIRVAPDAEMWCVLVRRKTPLPSRLLAQMTKKVVVLADKSTAIHTKYLEGLDAVSRRLSSEYASWIAEHDDSRGVPVFRFGVSHRLRDATSYAEALAHLGEDVRWIVPKGVAERMDEARTLPIVEKKRQARAAKKKTAPAKKKTTTAKKKTTTAKKKTATAKKKSVA
jgi:hypothetical protein